MLMTGTQRTHDVVCLLGIDPDEPTALARRYGFTDVWSLLFANILSKPFDKLLLYHSLLLLLLIVFLLFVYFYSTHRVQTAVHATSGIKTKCHFNISSGSIESAHQFLK